MIRFSLYFNSDLHYPNSRAYVSLFRSFWNVRSLMNRNSPKSVTYFISVMYGCCVHFRILSNAFHPSREMYFSSQKKLRMSARGLLHDSRPNVFAHSREMAENYFPEHKSNVSFYMWMFSFVSIIREKDAANAVMGSFKICIAVTSGYDVYYFENVLVLF